MRLKLSETSTFVVLKKDIWRLTRSKAVPLATKKGHFDKSRFENKGE